MEVEAEYGFHNQPNHDPKTGEQNFPQAHTRGQPQLSLFLRPQANDYHHNFPCTRHCPSSHSTLFVHRTARYNEQYFYLPVQWCCRTRDAGWPSMLHLKPLFDGPYQHKKVILLFCCQHGSLYEFRAPNTR